MKKPEETSREMPKIEVKTIKRLLSYLWKYKWRLAVVLASILLTTGAGVASSMFLGVLVDQYITPLLQVSNPDFSGLLHAVWLMAGIYAVGTVSSFLATFLMVPVVQGVLKDIRDQLFAKMQQLPIGYFDTHPFGDVMSRYNNDTDTLEQMVGQSLPNFVSSATMIILVTITMLVTSWQLTAVVVVMVVLMFAVTTQILRRSGSYFIKQQQSLGLTNAFIEEMISGQKVVKVFSYEEEAEKKFAKLNDDLTVQATQANRFANVLMPIMIHSSNLQYVMLAFAGGLMTVFGWGGVSLGMIASFMQLSRNLSMPINQISQQLNFVVMALAGAGRIFQLMDETVEDDVGEVRLVNVRVDNGQLVETSERTGHWAWKEKGPEGAKYTKLRGEVRFEQVNFAYQAAKPVLKEVSFWAKAGQKIAFVGATGAGKTTITNLLNRFYEVSEGQILYDGIEVKRIKKADLRRSLGMVLQDTHLFTGTVKENIRFGKLEATDEEVRAAAKRANADEFIRRLPKGYETKLGGDGMDLSQGQKQLLSIARAAISDPPVLILDEATSSIDTRTEKIVQDGMDKLMEGRTTLVIAHRLSTIRSAKAIMVMAHGEIIERGNHRDLMKEKGEYYQLYTGALELE